MTIIKKIRSNKCWRGCGGKGTNPLTQFMGTVLWKTVWGFFKKI